MDPIYTLLSGVEFAVTPSPKVSPAYQPMATLLEPFVLPPKELCPKEAL